MEYVFSIIEKEKQKRKEEAQGDSLTSKHKRQGQINIAIFKFSAMHTDV